MAKAQTMEPSRASNCDATAPLKPGSASSRTSSVILSFSVQPTESPFEWSARMKQYQQEEIEYLGLDVIKPQRPEHLEIVSSGHIIPVPSENTPHKYMRLSKQRFEEWLDTLSPRANPVIPVSQPSTVAESDVSQGNWSGTNPTSCQANQKLLGYFDGGFSLNSSFCNGCGKRMWSKGAGCDRSVQTDITGGLIII